jgi:cytochrome P450
MNQYISRVLDERYSEWRNGNVNPGLNKSAIDLVLADYITQRNGETAELDPGLRKWAIAQLRMMFFVAHESTAPTICYAFYLLSKNPKALQKLRDEHNEVLGDVSQTPHLLRTQPQLLDKLVYTTAVIKEVLRLFTPASGFRLGKQGSNLHDDQGNQYPTEDCRVWIIHSSLHRNPRYWKDPLSFIPERFLVAPDDPLYPIRGAWRPFEHGPRDCLGQPLAMLDLRVTLAMTARIFDINDAYVEWDAIHDIPKKRYCSFQGERAYQMGHGGAHPADRFPCRVSLRK